MLPVAALTRCGRVGYLYFGRLNDLTKGGGYDISPPGADVRAGRWARGTVAGELTVMVVHERI